VLTTTQTCSTGSMWIYFREWRNFKLVSDYYDEKLRNLRNLNTHKNECKCRYSLL